MKAATEAIHAQIQKHPEKKAQPVDFQNAQKQEDKEAEIIGEADKAIQLLQNEGSAVAFPAVFEEVRKDMLRVKERLHDANVGEDTQGIEQDIIDALTHMRDALKKAQQELGKTPPGPPGAAERSAAAAEAARRDRRVEDDPRTAEAGERPDEALRGQDPDGRADRRRRRSRRN